MSDFAAAPRTEWIELASRLYASLPETCARFTSAEWNRTTPYLGWRVRDVLAHLNGAMRVNFRQVLDRALAGDPSPPPEFDTFRRNAREVAARRAAGEADLIREFRTELENLMRTYRAISDADWLKPAWFFVGPVSVRTLFLVQFADTAFHERDMLLVQDRWRGLDPAYAGLLVDWFMREYRPASFRPSRARGLRAAVLYRLGGVGGGEWTMFIEDGRCTVGREAGLHPDVIVEAGVEDLMAAALARAAPAVGRLARSLEWIGGQARREVVVAAITGVSSLATGVLRRRVRTTGNRRLAWRVQRAFWHFWERPCQTTENIALGRR